MVSKDRRQRHGDAAVLLKRLERRRLLERDAHIESDRHQNRAEEEGNSPRPIDERRLAKANEQQKKEAGRYQEADRRAKLREHAVPCALSLRRVFYRNQSRPAPFAAKANALQETQRGKRQRRESARRCVRRQRAIRVVASPMVSMVATSVDLRPTRSPKWPNRNEPTGRARKARPNVR